MRADFNLLVVWNFSWFKKQNKRKAVASWYNVHVFQRSVPFRRPFPTGIFRAIVGYHVVIYIYTQIVVSMPGYTYCVLFCSRFWRSLMLLLLLCSCFCLAFFFYTAHLWDLGTPKMNRKGFVAHHRKWSVFEVVCTRNVNTIDFQDFLPSPSSVLWGKHSL